MELTKNRIFKTLALCASLLACGGANWMARAADVNLIVNCSTAQSWLTPAVWSDGNAPAAGNTYFAGRDRNNVAISGTLRTPTITGNATFAGDALYINSGATFANKTNGILTLKELFINSGTIGVWNGNQTQNIVADRLNFQGRPSISAVAAAANDKRVAVLKPTLMDGDGTITLALNPDPTNDDGVTFSPVDNTFSGDIIQNGGQSTFGTPAGLGRTGLLRVSYGGKVAFATDAVNSYTNLELRTTSTLTLDKNLSFKSVTINGARLADGTYPAASLSTTYPTNIVNGGGTLIIGGALPNTVRRAFLYE